MTKYKISSILIVLCLIFSIIISGCQGSDNQISLVVGESYVWQVGEGYTYSSSNENVATVNQSGEILGVGEGECTVSAVKQTKNKNIKIIVSGKSSSLSQSSFSQSQSSSSSQNSSSSLQNDNSNISSISQEISSATNSQSMQSSVSSSDNVNRFTATCIYEGDEYIVTVAEGEPYQRPIVNIEDGYFIEWFTDSEYSNSYNFNLEATRDIVLYGKKYQELNKSFWGYDNNRVTEINSLEDFQYYLEYTFFNEITSNNFVVDNVGVYDMLYDNTQRSALVNKTTCPFINLSYSRRIVDGEKQVQVLVGDVVPEVFLTQSGKGTYNQLIYAGYSEGQSSRTANFNDFAYQNFTEQTSVKNSNQLFFALEHRVKPIPVSGSNAEIALNKCKDILRSICDDNMSDLEKVKAIYEYVILNTEYVLPTETENPQVLYYDAFYMEGVLNNGAAVCDGISKTISALCNIEGIRCVRTASSSHAWNEVFVNGKWYTIDATHGNIQKENKEILSFGNFLINESLKQTMGYEDGLRTEIVADGEFNYFAWQTFTYNQDEYDYVISSQKELNYLLGYCAELSAKNSYESFTVEFILDFSCGFSFTDELQTALSLSGLNQYECSVSNIMARKIYILMFE